MNKINNFNNVRNHVLEHYLSAVPKADSWDEIDEQSGMKVSAFTYITLFLNDQVYGYEAMLEDEIKKSKIYRERIKYCFKRLHQAVKEYNRLMMNTLSTGQSELMADILSSLEGELKPSLDTYMYQVSQYLLDAGINGEANRFASIASTINMLAQTSNLTISVFNDTVCKPFRIDCNPLQYLNMDKLKFLSGELGDILTPKREHINLNEGKGIVAAFTSFNNRLLYSGAFERAIAGAEKEAG